MCILNKTWALRTNLHHFNIQPHIYTYVHGICLDSCIEIQKPRWIGNSSKNTIFRLTFLWKNFHTTGKYVGQKWEYSWTFSLVPFPYGLQVVFTKRGEIWILCCVWVIKCLHLLLCTKWVDMFSVFSFIFMDIEVAWIFKIQMFWNYVWWWKQHGWYVLTFKCTVCKLNFNSKKNDGEFWKFI